MGEIWGRNGRETAVAEWRWTQHQFVHHKTPFLGYVSAVAAGAGFAARHVGEAAGQLERLRAMPAAELAQRYSDDKAAGEINEQVSQHDSPG